MPSTPQAGAHLSAKSLPPTDPSLQQQAAPYHLATVKFPIDHVDPQWSDGRNRAINEAHCRRLCKMFESSLERTDPAHRLRIACPKADVDRMMQYLQDQGQSEVVDDASAPWRDFMEWKKSGGRAAILLAGNHRVKALQELLRKQGCDENDLGERWWICDIYDQGGSH